MRTPFRIALAFTALLVVAACLFIDVIPPRNLTATRMWVTKRRIIQFGRQHQRLPSNLAELPPMPDYDTDTDDAWKRRLDYTFDNSGTVTLSSLGADKRRGGEGDDGDMIGVFESRDANGQWQDELAPWSKDPLKP